MPRKDLYHDTVVQALVEDGWTITDDPLHLSYGGRNLYADLGAERPIGAEKAGRRIAVEIKSFLGASDVHDLSLSVGQFRVYRDILADLASDRELYLAVPAYVYEGIFQEPLGQLVIQQEQLQLLIFDHLQGRIRQWIP